MKKFLSVFLLAVYGICNGQNLVPNPGFEDYDSLPCNFIDTSSQFANMLHDWTVPNFTTPDICSPLISSSCLYGNPLSFNSAGLQTPRTGNIMVGMVCENGGYNEYIQVPLITPLVAGNDYQAEMYVSLAAKSDFANNDIGMYFSDTLINDVNFQSTNYTPQVLDTITITDTLNWVLVSGCFTATTAAQYLVIGNFISPCLRGVYLGGGWPMAYYFFDDISVMQIPSCTGGQLNCTDGIPEDENHKMKVYPNPVADMLTIENASIGATVEIINLLGEKIITQKITGNKSQLNLHSMAKGIYFVRVGDEERNVVRKLVVE